MFVSDIRRSDSAVSLWPAVHEAQAKQKTSTSSFGQSNRISCFVLYAPSTRPFPKRPAPQPPPLPPEVRICSEEPHRIRLQRSAYTKLIRALGVSKRKTPGARPPDLCDWDLISRSRSKVSGMMHKARKVEVLESRSLKGALTLSDESGSGQSPVLSCAKPLSGQQWESKRKWHSLFSRAGGPGQD